jgi:hypothetical protein
MTHETILAEYARIQFLLNRDGIEATIIWVKRTLKIYRRALLNQRHFARTPSYRRSFIASCLCFRQWLAAQRRALPAVN